jgi:hypothetical protein
MSTTINEYRGRWFKGGDVLLGIWAHLLANEIDRRSNQEPWLLEMRDHFRELARNGVFMDLKLEYFVSTDRIPVMLELIQEVNRTLDSYGDAIPIAELERMNMTGTQFMPSGGKTDSPKKLSRTIIKLLTGDRTPDEEMYSSIHDVP